MGQQGLPQDPGELSSPAKTVPCVPRPRSCTNLKLARVLLQEFLAIRQVLPGLGSERRGDPFPATQFYLRQSSIRDDSFRTGTFSKLSPLAIRLPETFLPRVSCDKAGPGLATV